MKPYLEISMNRAAETPTNVCVRSPALFWRISRSAPTSADSTNANVNSPSCSQPCPWKFNMPQPPAPCICMHQRGDGGFANTDCIRAAATSASAGGVSEMPSSRPGRGVSR